MKSNKIEYSFRGKLDVDLLAENMRKDKTPIVIITEKNCRPYLIILRSFRKHYKGEDLPLTAFCFFDTYRMRNDIHRKAPLTDPWYIDNEEINETLSNIKAIIKSHEQACLPKVKVLAVETTADWSNR